MSKKYIPKLGEAIQNCRGVNYGGLEGDNKIRKFTPQKEDCVSIGNATITTNITGTMQSFTVLELVNQLNSALAAISHLREAAKSGNKEDIDHALSATSGYDLPPRSTP